MGDFDSQKVVVWRFYGLVSHKKTFSRTYFHFQRLLNGKNGFRAPVFVQVATVYQVFFKVESVSNSTQISARHSLRKNKSESMDGIIRSAIERIPFFCVISAYFTRTGINSKPQRDIRVRSKMGGLKS